MLDLKDELVSAIVNITSIEEKIQEVLDKQDDINDRENDLIHYIENNSLSTNGCQSVVRELRGVLRERRRIKQLWDLNKTYDDMRLRLNNKENRQFVIAELNKKAKSLPTEYRNRVYTQEELDKIAKKSK